MSKHVRYRSSLSFLIASFPWVVDGYRLFLFRSWTESIFGNILSHLVVLPSWSLQVYFRVYSMKHVTINLDIKSNQSNAIHAPSSTNLVYTQSNQSSILFIYWFYNLYIASQCWKNMKRCTHPSAFWLSQPFGQSRWSLVWWSRCKVPMGFMSSLVWRASAPWQLSVKSKWKTLEQLGSTWDQGSTSGSLFWSYDFIRTQSGSFQNGRVRVGTSQ